MKFIGVDYSLTCPCVCVTEDGEFVNSKFFYRIDKKSAVGKFNNMIGEFHPLFNSDEERYENNAKWVLGTFAGYSDVKIMIEGYSFGSSGKVFNLAENCGLLKHYLYKGGYDFNTVPPTVIKKDATSKGNARKELMYETFVKDTGIELHKMFSPNAKNLGSPTTDIIDSWYIARYLKKQEEK